MITAIVSIIVFGVIVLIHELGHFTVAKLVGIKVHEFAIGMGPQLAQIKKGETAYTIRWLPLGGYVRMEGHDEASDDSGSFSKKTIGQRIGVIVAGPLMNFVLSIVLFTIIFYSLGMPSTIIREVVDQSPAQVAGIRQGDEIYAINDTRTRSWRQVTDIIGNSQDESLEIVLLRNDEKIKTTVMPEKDSKTNQVLIGISPEMKKSLISSIKNGILTILMITRDILGFLKGLITRQASTGEVMGPVGIINLVGEFARAGILDLLNFTAVISVNLGLMNLLPIPALDGSRILFLIFEFLRGKPVDPEKEGMVHLVGFGLLMTLMLFVTYQDVIRLFSR